MSEKYKIKNTLGMFDLLKGFIMISMILFHTYEKEPIITLFLYRLPPFLGAAFMPALFVITGYRFRKTTFTKCLKSQVQTIIKPIAVVILISSVIHFLYYYFVFSGGFRISTKETLRLFAGMFFGLARDKFMGAPIIDCGPLWFFWALLWGNILLNILVTYFDEWKLLIASMIVSAVGYVLGIYFSLPWALSHGMVAVLFFSIGYLIKKHKIFTTVYSTVKLRIVFCAFIVMNALEMLAGDYFNLAYHSYKFGFLSILLCGLNAVFVIYCFLHLNRFKGKISDILRVLGRYSLYFFCIHSIELLGFGRYLQYDLANSWKWHPALYSFLLFGSRILFTSFATFAFVKTKSYIATRRAK